MIWIAERLIPDPCLSLTNLFLLVAWVNVRVHYNRAVSTNPDQFNQFVLAAFSECKMAEHFAPVVHEEKITPFDKDRQVVRSMVS